MANKSLPSVDEVKALVRSVLLPHGSAMPLRQLLTDFHELAGIDLPLFGFASPVALLQSMTDTVRVRRMPDGEVMVGYVRTDDTRHITSLVQGKCGLSRPLINGLLPAGQKKDPKKTRGSRPLTPTNLFAPHTSARQSTSPRNSPRSTNYSPRNATRQQNSFHLSTPNSRTSLGSPANERSVTPLEKIDEWLSVTQPTVAVTPKDKQFRSQTSLSNRNNNRSSPSPQASVNLRRQSATPPPRHNPKYKELLANLCYENQLGSFTYNSTLHQDKNKHDLYYCQVTVAGKTFKACRDFRTQAEAEEAAAKAAYFELREQFNLFKGCRTDDDTSNILNNIKTIVEASVFGFRGKENMEKEYAKRYHKQLPSNWLKMVEDCKKVFEIEIQSFYNKEEILILLSKPKIGPSGEKMGIPTTQSSQLNDSFCSGDGEGELIMEDALNLIPATPEKTEPDNWNTPLVQTSKYTYQWEF